MNRKTLAILGASGHGKVLADIAEQCGYDVAFFDDSVKLQSSIEHWKVHGNTDDLCKSISCYDGVAIGIGNNKIRLEKFAVLKRVNAKFPTLVHPTAIVSSFALLEEAVVVMPGAIVNAFAKVECGTIVNSNAVIEHDCFVGRFSHISPSVSIAGGCFIEKYAWIGIGSCLRQCVTVGQAAIIGAGSVVVKDIPSGETAYGCPAKVVNT